MFSFFTGKKLVDAATQTEPLDQKKSDQERVRDLKLDILSQQKQYFRNYLGNLDQEISKLDNFSPLAIAIDENLIGHVAHWISSARTQLFNVKELCKSTGYYEGDLKAAIKSAISKCDPSRAKKIVNVISERSKLVTQLESLREKITIHYNAIYNEKKLNIEQELLDNSIKEISRKSSFCVIS